QAGWFDRAHKELDALAKDLPEQKKRVERAREALVRLESREAFEQVKRWHKAGRHQAVLRRLEKFPAPKGTPEKLLADVRELRAAHGRTTERLKEARRHLAALVKQVKGAEHKVLVEAAPAILRELHPSNVDRLEAFLGQARQLERDKARKRKSERTPAEVLAL